MIKTKLGKSDLYVSKVALGTVQFGVDYGFSKKKNQSEVDSILNCAAHNGINFIDTASEYGDSERKIGDYLSRHSKQFIVATKLKKMLENEVNNTFVKEKILSSVKNSLENLNLRNLDILQLHQTDDYLITNEVFWQTISELKNEGTIIAFGVSVYEIKETLELANKYSDIIDFFQIPYNVFDRRFEEIKGILDDKSISIVSRSTFLKGIIPCEIADLPPELEELKPYKESLEDMAISLKISVSELAMLFVFCSNNIESILLGVDSISELESNVLVTNKYSCTLLENLDFSKTLVKNSFLIDPRKWTSL